MFRKFHDLKGFSTNVGNRYPRWRTVFIALVLVLVIGSAGPASTAQAAPAGDTIARFFMKANYATAQSRICIGDKVSINAVVWRELPEVDIPGTGDDLSPLATRLTGIRVKASVGDTSIGIVIFPERETGWTSGESPGVAPFVFHAKNPGRTTISFEAKIPTQWSFGIPFRRDIVTAKLDVTVEQCQYKVTVISTFRAGMTSVGRMEEAVFKLDEDGQFEGGAIVSWVTSILCGINSPISTSEAVIAAKTVGDDIEVTVTFLPSSSIGGGSCGSISVTTSNSTDPTLSPLTITVPSWGGSATKPQTVTAKNGSFTGSALIIVTPARQQ